jgi:hypothetical protein
MSKHGSTCLTKGCDVRGGCSGYRSGNILCREGYKSNMRLRCLSSLAWYIDIKSHHKR